MLHTVRSMGGSSVIASRLYTQIQFRSPAIPNNNRWPLKNFVDSSKDVVCCGVISIWEIPVHVTQSWGKKHTQYYVDSGVIRARKGHNGGDRMRYYCSPSAPSSRTYTHTHTWPNHMYCTIIIIGKGGAKLWMVLTMTDWHNGFPYSLHILYTNVKSRVTCFPHISVIS